MLFERVLSSGGLTPQLSVEVWNRFLEFESNIGDLSSIVKVERRRSAILENLKEFEGKETAQLVDRYKFLDLFPCGVVELKSIGYSDVSFNQKAQFTRSKTKLHLLQTTGLLSSKATTSETDEIVSQLPRPDFSQMIPYKPKSTTFPGEHPLAGGTFPQPPALAALCKKFSFYFDSFVCFILD